MEVRGEGGGQLLGGDVMGRGIRERRVRIRGDRWVMEQLLVEGSKCLCLNIHVVLLPMFQHAPKLFRFVL